MNKLNILIVEDESLLALELATSVKKHGYNVVDYVTTLKETKKAIKNNMINLIVMDINLNDSFDGIDLYNCLNTNAFVIYLTAYKDDETMSKAIATEPLGYLIKPHNENELLALLKLAEIKLQRLPSQNCDASKINLSNGYSFDLHHEMLYHNDVFQKLSVKKLKLMKLLIEAKGEAISFKNIEEELWQENSPSDSSIRTLIYRLRSELAPGMIETESNYGIKLTVS